MDIREHEPLKGKTTMRIGGAARYYAELRTRADAETAWRFVQERSIPLIVLGGGSNTVFAEGTVEALVVRIRADRVTVDGNRTMAEAGKPLASLINELAEQNLDLSALAGIPGTLGGAIFGNAGQGSGGTWIDSFVLSVTALIDGKWQTLPREECHFRYRESAFKEMEPPSIIWEATLTVPSRPAQEVKGDIERLLQKRIETQPHLKTAGSCFKALPDGTPAWKLIERSGLRGLQIGGVQVSEKHANFFLNVADGTFGDVASMIRRIQESAPELAEIEMRLYGTDGRIRRAGPRP